MVRGAPARALARLPTGPAGAPPPPGGAGSLVPGSGRETRSRRPLHPATPRPTSRLTRARRRAAASMRRAGPGRARCWAETRAGRALRSGAARGRMPGARGPAIYSARHHVGGGDRRATRLAAAPAPAA